jgi:hypothetical protein
MKKLLLLAAIPLIFSGHSGEARENRLVKCNIYAARADPGSGGPALVANVPRSMTPISLNAVQMTDKTLRRKMVVEGLFAMRNEADNIEVTARFVNCTNNDLVIQARSSFMDGNQFPTEKTSGWTNVAIPARATGVYTERSISGAKVQHFLVEIRNAN